MEAERPDGPTVPAGGTRPEPEPEPSVSWTPQPPLSVSWTPQPPPPASQQPVGPASAAAPRPYPQLLRSQTYRWWRPLLSLVAGMSVVVAIFAWLIIGYGALESFAGADAADALEEGVGGFVFGNLLLAMAIPAAILGVAAGFRRPPGWLASVELRMRWGWLARCAAVVVAWAVVTTGVWIALDGLPDTGGDDIALLIALCLLTTPLQAAGEEYLVRGWLTQSIAAWFARPLLGAAVAGLISAVVFALLHGSQNVWLFSDRLAFGLIASYLAWRTGGLEAPIALHAVANIATIIPSVLEGSLDETLVITEAPVGVVALDVLSLLLAAALVVWLARRRRIRRVFADPALHRGPADLGSPAADR